MKCRKCGGRMVSEHDRIRCLACGWSRWDNISTRVPGHKERTRAGDTTRWSKTSKLSQGVEV